MTKNIDEYQLRKVKNTVIVDGIEVTSWFMVVMIKNRQQTHHYEGAKKYRTWLQTLRLLGFKFNKLVHVYGNSPSDPNLVGIRVEKIYQRAYTSWVSVYRAPIANSRFFSIERIDTETLGEMLGRLETLKLPWRMLSLKVNDEVLLISADDFVALTLKYD